jgi:hypothetical protein
MGNGQFSINNDQWRPIGSLIVGHWPLIIENCLRRDQWAMVNFQLTMINEKPSVR